VKVFLWVVAGLIALVWTATIGVSVGVASWAVQLLESGRAIDWAREASQWPVPGWIAIWVDADLVRWAQEFAVWSLETLQRTLPFARAVLDWAVPLAWATWGFGMLVLLGLAGGAHWLMNRQWASTRPA